MEFDFGELILLSMLVQEMLSLLQFYALHLDRIEPNHCAGHQTLHTFDKNHVLGVEGQQCDNGPDGLGLFWRGRESTLGEQMS